MSEEDSLHVLIIEVKLLLALVCEAGIPADLYMEGQNPGSAFSEANIHVS